jgi:hypothetical protein
MRSDKTPSSGGRTVLELIDVGEQAVRYRAELFTPDGTAVGEATIDLASGGITWAPWSPTDPPTWLVKYAHTFLRSAWRVRADSPWPPRISRWRDARDPG